MTIVRANVPAKGVFHMNRTVLIGAIVVLLAASGYYQLIYKPEQAREMVAEAEKKAAEAAAAAEAQAAEAAAATEAAAAEATAAAEAAAADAAAATTEAVTEGAAAATDGAAAALDPATFNADAVIALIDGSTVDDATKATLKTAVEAARANPALVADTVAQVKTALGM
jgi:hypothetical protein